jgi:hypothetical protein
LESVVNSVPVHDLEQGAGIPVRKRDGHGPRRLRWRDGSRPREAPMTLVVNLILYAGLALVPLGIAVLFIRLGRRFSRS